MRYVEMLQALRHNLCGVLHDHILTEEYTILLVYECVFGYVGPDVSENRSAFNLKSHAFQEDRRRSLHNVSKRR